jgi:hypothetical protein
MSSPEPQPKRDGLTGWFIGVGALLLLAAAVPVALKLYGPREMVMELQGDPGGQIVWQCQTDGRIQSGVTNLPVKLVFQSRITVFIAHRTNYSGPLQLNAVVDGSSRGSITLGGSTGGVRFQHGMNSWGISGTK